LASKQVETEAQSGIFNRQDAKSAKENETYVSNRGWQRAFLRALKLQEQNEVTLSNLGVLGALAVQRSLRRQNGKSSVPE
jgi:hypothetical protein